jgi:hypothetical protein
MVPCFVDSSGTQACGTLCGAARRASSRGAGAISQPQHRSSSCVPDPNVLKHNEIVFANGFTPWCALRRECGASRRSARAMQGVTEGVSTLKQQQTRTLRKTVSRRVLVLADRECGLLVTPSHAACHRPF